MASEVESEFGIPFPGHVLPRIQWTRTGYRDTGRSFNWEEVFGRRAPRVVDLGCGNGRYLIGSALARPDRDHLGLDLVQRAIDFAAHRANKRGLRNVRFMTADAARWLFGETSPESLSEIHVYHPQPYYEASQIAQRLLTPEFLERAWVALARGGLLVLQTDNKAYWRYLLGAVRKHFDPEAIPGPWPDAPRGRTRREILARQKGLVVWRMVARRRDHPRPGEIPRPLFDANRPRFRKPRGKGP
jgi:tRNA (guanine-N7-)-methyltransferase